MTNHNPHIIIIGGGIAGLATAYYLQKEAQANNFPLSYTLIERNAGFGGKIVSESRDGFVIEGGPDSFLTQKPWALELCRDLGLDDRLIGTNDHQRQVFILHKGRLCPFPDGMRLTVPTKIIPFVRTPLLSPWGKLRAGLDFFIPPKTGDQDESIADFIGRRMGQEVVDKLAAPIMAGIHVADPRRLSIQSTFPYFPAIEKKHGSLIKGIFAQKKAMAGRASAKPKNSMFMTLKGGLSELVDTLVDHLQGELIVGQEVTNLQITAPGPKQYQVHLANGQIYAADALVLATPAYVSANLLKEHSPALAHKLNQIRYLSTATISLGYHQHQVSHPLDGFGFVVPKSEPCHFLACTWVSTKFNHRAPAGQVLLRVFVGGYGQEALVDLPDDELVTLVRGELARIMGIRAEPIQQRIYRWPKANPQYDVGHLDHVAAIESLAQEELPGLHLTGSAFRGVGMPDCVHQGQETAKQALQRLIKLKSSQQIPQLAPN